MIVENIRFLTSKYKRIRKEKGLRALPDLPQRFSKERKKILVELIKVSFTKFLELKLKNKKKGF